MRQHWQAVSVNVPRMNRKSNVLAIDVLLALPTSLDKKDHRNGIKKVKTHRYTSLKGVSSSHRSRCLLSLIHPAHGLVMPIVDVILCSLSVLPVCLMVLVRLTPMTTA